MNDGYLEQIVRSMESSVIEANEAILDIYRQGFNVQIKSDNSPVTDADFRGNEIIHSHLDKYDEIGWLSEEDKDDLNRLNHEYVFVVDPLDGTQDFVNKDNSFGINLALVKNGKPLVAFIGIPFYHCYAYAYKGRGAFLFNADHSRNKLRVSDRVNDLVYLSSKTHEVEQERKLMEKHSDRISKIIHSGASTKAILLASGQGDVSIRYTNMTKEWDVCAPDLIVREAGGIFLDTKKQEFTYNRVDVYNHDGYCMFNRKENLDLLDYK